MTAQLLLLGLFVFCMILMSINHGKKKKKVIFFGDTINDLDTKPGGYISWIIDHLKNEGSEERYNLVSAVKPGEKIYDLYLRLEDNVLLKDATIVIIYVGVNDVWDKYLKGTGTDPVTFESLYQAMVNKLVAANIKVIICSPASALKEGFPKEMENEMDDYADITRKVAADNNLQLVDLHQVFAQHVLLPNETRQGEVNNSRLVADEIWRVLSNVR
jgi:lysophospholipase L1-like esterase